MLSVSVGLPVCVLLRAYFQNHTSKFCVPVSYGCGSVILWCPRCDTLRTSGLWTTSSDNAPAAWYWLCPVLFDGGRHIWTIPSKRVSGAKSAVHHRLAFLNQTSPAFVHCYNMSLYLQLACKRLSWQHSDYDGKIYRVAQNKIPHWRICNISANGGLILKILEAT